MKKFLIRAGILLLPFVLIFIFMEYYCRNESVIAIKRDYTESKINDLNVIILGSSHLQDGLNPEFLDLSSSNIAFGGQTLSIDYFLLEKYLQTASTKLEWIVLDVSPHRFYIDLIEDDWNHRIYRVIYGIKYKTEKPDIDNYSLVLSGFDFFSKTVWKGINPFSKKATINKFGFVLNDMPDRFSKLGFDSTKAIQTWSQYYHFTDSLEYKLNGKWLDKIIALCKTKRVKLLLLNPPVYNTFYNTIPNKSKLGIDSIIEKKADRKEVFYLDLMESESFSFVDFKNDNHLNTSGAKKFTRMLNQFLMNQKENARGE